MRTKRSLQSQTQEHPTKRLLQFFAHSVTSDSHHLLQLDECGITQKSDVTLFYCVTPQNSTFTLFSEEEQKKFNLTFEKKFRNYMFVLEYTYNNTSRIELYKVLHTAIYNLLSLFELQFVCRWFICDQIISTAKNFSDILFTVIYLWLFNQHLIMEHNNASIRLKNNSTNNSTPIRQQKFNIVYKYNWYQTIKISDIRTLSAFIAALKQLYVNNLIQDCSKYNITCFDAIRFDFKKGKLYVVEQTAAGDGHEFAEKYLQNAKDINDAVTNLRLLSIPLMLTLHTLYVYWGLILGNINPKNLLYYTTADKDDNKYAYKLKFSDFTSVCNESYLQCSAVKDDPQFALSAYDIVTGASDIFSLALTLSYMLLKGRSNKFNTYFAVIETDPRNQAKIAAALNEISTDLFVLSQTLIATKNWKFVRALQNLLDFSFQSLIEVIDYVNGDEENEEEETFYLEQNELQAEELAAVDTDTDLQ